MAKAEIKNLQTRFKEDIAPKLKEELGLNNVMSVPKLSKVVINSGISHDQKKDYQHIVENLTLIAGQKPTVNRSKLSVSNFKIREGDVVGASVTLRGKAMYDFINKLVNIVFPRVRDFRGISPKSFDGQGNYSVGFKEHVMFPEISPDDILKIHGLQVCISTTAKTEDEGKALLTALGFPFKKQL
ncbi:50S ribosomal protein L5 [Candidatus Gracilibacteria bacterium]|nr:50S ribosomal protein L5 [Candidatus Gracilibacteria bacterium]